VCGVRRSLAHPTHKKKKSYLVQRDEDVRAKVPEGQVNVGLVQLLCSDLHFYGAKAVSPSSRPGGTVHKPRSAIFGTHFLKMANFVRLQCRAF